MGRHAYVSPNTSIACAKYRRKLEISPANNFPNGVSLAQLPRAPKVPHHILQKKKSTSWRMGEIFVNIFMGSKTWKNMNAFYQSISPFLWNILRPFLFFCCWCKGDNEREIWMLSPNNVPRTDISRGIKGAMRYENVVRESYQTICLVQKHKR